MALVVTEELKRRLWNKCRRVNGYNEDCVRMDACGAYMVYEKYGDLNSKFGWEIDHICPRSLLISLGVSEDDVDKEENLRAFHWKNNKSKGSDYPFYSMAIKGEGNKNIEAVENRRVNEHTRQLLRTIFESDKL